MLSRVWQYQVGRVLLEKRVSWEEGEEEEAGGDGGCLDGHRAADTKCWRGTISAVLIEKFGSFSNISLPCLGEGTQTFCGRNTPKFVHKISSLTVLLHFFGEERKGVFPALADKLIFWNRCLRV